MQITINVSHGGYRKSLTLESDSIESAINQLHNERIEPCGYAIETSSPRFNAFKAELLANGKAGFGWADYTLAN